MPIEHAPPAGDARRRSQQANNGCTKRGLAGARFANQTHTLACLQAEGHALDGLDWPVGGDVLDPQVFDAQDLAVWAHVRCLSLGFAMRSNPAESKNSPTKMNEIATIGGPHHHHWPRSTALNLSAQ